MKKKKLNGKLILLIVFALIVTFFFVPIPYYLSQPISDWCPLNQECPPNEPQVGWNLGPSLFKLIRTYERPSYGAPMEDNSSSSFKAK